MKKIGMLILVSILLFLVTSTILTKEKSAQIILNDQKSTEQDSSTYLDNWRYEQETDLYKYYRKKGQIVMLGNSITYRVDWNELLDRNDIINRGIGSDITEGFLSRMEYVYNVNPKLCFVMGGINDIGQGIEPEIIVSNIDEIITKLKEKNIKPILLSILYVAETHSEHKRINKDVKITNNKIEQVCAKRGIEYVNLNKSLSKNEALREEYSVDGVHLTGLGYDKWREIISPIIDREMN